MKYCHFPSLHLNIGGIIHFYGNYTQSQTVHYYFSYGLGYYKYIIIWDNGENYIIYFVITIYLDQNLSKTLVI